PSVSVAVRSVVRCSPAKLPPTEAIQPAVSSDSRSGTTDEDNSHSSVSVPDIRKPRTTAVPPCMSLLSKNSPKRRGDVFERDVSSRQ
uniref:Ovule protein n=1 Tax=Parascaris univalens TaxID=6257 RepID=A0A915BPA4_PARUN